MVMSAVRTTVVHPPNVDRRRDIDRGWWCIINRRWRRDVHRLRREGATYHRAETKSQDSSANIGTTRIRWSDERKHGDSHCRRRNSNSQGRIHWRPPTFPADCLTNRDQTERPQNGSSEAAPLLRSARCPIRRPNANPRSLVRWLRPPGVPPRMTKQGRRGGPKPKRIRQVAYPRYGPWFGPGPGYFPPPPPRRGLFCGWFRGPYGYYRPPRRYDRSY